MELATRILHPAPIEEAAFDGLSAPLVRASTLVFRDVRSFLSRGDRFFDGYSYALYGHPASRELERRIAALEGAVRAIAVPSGLCAISLVNLSMLASGDQVLVPDSVYSPARVACDEMLASFGIRATYYDPVDLSVAIAECGEEIKLIWVESPGSLTMEMQDLPAICALAKQRGVKVAVDNTWASPLNHRPIELGADISIQAISKHVGGHSDLILGTVATAKETDFRVIKTRARHLGLGVSPDDCWLALRGLETLAVRLQRQERTALELALWLDAHPSVSKVLFPALPVDDGHDLWRRDFHGACGVFSVVLMDTSIDAASAFIERLKLFKIGASWGGTRSLIAPSDPSQHRTATCRPHGLIIRISVGLEDTADLIADLDQALSVLSIAQGDASPHRLASI
jgi:cysteine-S-conjugate beta-lyase